MLTTFKVSFLYMFCYMVLFSLLGLPNLSEESSEEDLESLINLAKVFQLPSLVNICNNLKDEEAALNASIATCINDERRLKMKEIFLNQPTLADISFDVQGKIHYMLYFIFDKFNTSSRSPVESYTTTAL